MVLDILCTAVSWFVYTCAFLFLVNALTFLIPFLLHTYVFTAQDLKKKYNGAKWAVVTGGSSGIGRAITEKLASQGINVVIVALADDLLGKFKDTISAQYPDLEFRTVGVDMSKPTAVQEIIDATGDIDVQLLFNNAGYIQICFFADADLQRQMNNLTVNATIAVQLTHHYINKMTAKNLKGCVVFTSSPAGAMPCPFSVIYGSSKAFITEFATSLAGEVRLQGIDVLVAHPSPVDTNFYHAPSASKSASVTFFRKTASPPTVICDYMFRTVGRYTCVVEQGYFAFMQKFIFKVLDPSFFASLLMVFSWTTAEYKTLTQDRKKK